MKEKTKIILVIVGVLVVIGIGITFAYFSANANQEGEGSSTTVTTTTIGETTLTVEGNIEFNDLDIYPGHKNVSSIKVTATGEKTILYNLIWTGENTLNTSLKYYVYKTESEESPSITCEKKEEGSLTKIYYETCTENNFANLGEVISSGEITTTSTSTKFTLLSDEEIKASEEGTSVYYYVVLEYPNNEESQNIDMGGTFEGVVSIEYTGEKVLTAAETILANSKVNEGTPDFSQVATTDEGVWTAEDDLGTSYYFRGAVENNYLKFAGYYWRIIRINGDDSIRIIYDGTSAHANGESSDDRQIKKSEYNENYDYSYYVGYTYVSGYQRPSQAPNTEEEYDSAIKTILDSWYQTNIANIGYDDKVVSAPGFCNDRKTGSDYIWSSRASFRYIAYERLVTNKMPTLGCGDQVDLYTTKIGLITADEVVYAGGTTETNNKSYYLYTGQYYWTMSPFFFDSGYACVFAVYPLGKLNNISVDNKRGVRPVINLSAGVTLTGTGTMSDPYVVEGAE